jgi:hypothetical protein
MNKWTATEWRVRKTVDETGDYPFPTYDILAIHEWGPEAVACAYQNPNNARLIAVAPDMLEALIRCYKIFDKSILPNDVEMLKSVIEKATGQTVEQVMGDRQ